MNIPSIRNYHAVIIYASLYGKSDIGLAASINQITWARRSRPEWPLRPSSLIIAYRNHLCFSPNTLGLRPWKLNIDAEAFSALRKASIVAQGAR
jgi:hypothetical protein